MEELCQGVEWVSQLGPQGPSWEEVPWSRTISWRSFTRDRETPHERKARVTISACLSRVNAAEGEITVQFTFPLSWNTVPPPLRLRTKSTSPKPGGSFSIRGAVPEGVCAAVRRLRFTSSHGF
jgi:hypothetical protein